MVCFAGEEKVLFRVILRGRDHIQTSLEEWRGQMRGWGLAQSWLVANRAPSLCQAGDTGAKGLDWILFGLLFEDLEKNLAYLKCI